MVKNLLRCLDYRTFPGHFGIFREFFAISFFQKYFPVQSESFEIGSRPNPGIEIQIVHDGLFDFRHLEFRLVHGNGSVSPK